MNSAEIAGSRIRDQPDENELQNNYCRKDARDLQEDVPDRYLPEK